MSPLDDTLVSCGSETLPPVSSPKFCMYGSPHHQITKSRYITSNDPRGYIPVYEYPLNNQWIMMDSDDGYVLWTGIWKGFVVIFSDGTRNLSGVFLALGNNKADIVKMLETQPELGPLLRRVRGGFLKIQGTWMPYEVALRLSRRVAWTIRNDLIPLFGPTFPSTCLTPDQPGFGQLSATGTGSKRKSRRSYNPIPHSGSQIPFGCTSPLPIPACSGPANPLYDCVSASAPVPSYGPPFRTAQQNSGRYSPYESQDHRLSLPFLATNIYFGRTNEHVPPSLPTVQPQPIALPPISAMDDYIPSERSADILHRLKHNNDAFMSSSMPILFPNRNSGVVSPAPLSSSCSTTPSLVTGDSDSRHGSPIMPRTPSSLSSDPSACATKTQSIVSSGFLPLNRHWFSETSSSSHVSLL